MSRLLPKNFDDISLKDLPNSLSTEKPFIPWFTVAIQATYGDMYQALKDCVKVKEQEKKFQQAKIGMTFSRDLNREKVITTFSVRSAFDLFL